ncbi:DUF5666 domain-containing protein [Leifsonia shinshuensis]|uniref:Uncharacterized protein n=1 Tax=Leifsonia shinshuensis TaxID=150026 RepID=A0A7G6Y818_9MICO|nr:DUF5666 domain-containing protein [Leifsonia shinshuensis]QNE34633.1 hypothetical protein F1C12_05525 [Leifsonia shinshuensis]
MDENQPTEPLYPQQPGAQNEVPRHDVPPQQAAHPYGPPTQQYGPPARPVGEPFYKRHGLAFAISTLVLGVIVLFGIAGTGAFAVGSVVFHAGSSVSRLLHDGQGGPVPVKPGAPGQNGKGNGSGSGQGGRQDEGPIAKGVVRGTVASISGSTWTIRTQRGTTLTVDTTSSTVYGAPGQTQRASDFAAGDEVIVVGTRSGTTVTAVRILNVADLPLRPGQSGPTPTPSPSS